MTPGPQVVQKNNVWDVEFLGKSLGIHDPGKIGSAHAAVDDRPGDTEAGGHDAFLAQMSSGLMRKFLGDALELRVLFASEALREDGRESAAIFRQERQITLRPANVACKDHRFPLARLLALVYFRRGN